MRYNGVLYQPDVMYQVRKIGTVNSGCVCGGKSATVVSITARENTGSFGKVLHDAL